MTNTMNDYLTDIRAMLPADPTLEQVRAACIDYFEDPSQPLLPLAAYLLLTGQVS